MAQAANQVLQQNKQAAAQQQAQQQAQDPVIQMQQQELQLKMQELELKKQQFAATTAARADELDIKETQVSGQLQLEAMKLSAQMQDTAQAREADQLRDGVKMGIQVGRDRADLLLRQNQQGGGKE
jgi:hypothetical protein